MITIINHSYKDLRVDMDIKVAYHSLTSDRCRMNARRIIQMTGLSSSWTRRGADRIIRMDVKMNVGDVLSLH